PQVRRAAAEGFLAGRHRLQGQRVLQDRQPGRGQERVAQAQGEGEGDDLGVLLLVIVVLRLVVDELLVRQQLEEGQQNRVTPGAEAEIGVFGGSGFYSFLDDSVEVTLDTPYGAPAAPVTIGDVGGRRVAFLPRHGRRHELPPHCINYRANLWAMREVGVTRLIGPCAAGSLQPAVAPGDFVVPDQLIDRTWGRADTFYEGPVAHHVSYADPYCAELSAVAVEAARAAGITVHPTGTVIV